MSCEPVIRAFWRSMGTNDFVAASLYLSEDFEHFMPQSGEYLTGRRDFASFNAAYPAKGLWRFDIRSVVADADQAVSDVAVTDGDMSARAITFHHLKDGLIWRQTEYWPDPYPPQAWRGAYVTVLNVPPF